MRRPKWQESANRDGRQIVNGNCIPSGASLGPLENLLKSVMPEPARFEAVNTGVGHIHMLAQQLTGVNAACVVQGSYAQGLGLRGSDLDVAIITDASAPVLDSSEVNNAVEKRKALTCLKMLANEIASLGSTEMRIALRIFSARVPVLRLHFELGAGCSNTSCKKENDAASARLVVDVSVGANLGRGACDRCVYSLLESDNSGLAAALCRLVKLWAKRRQLTNTLKGGLSSFGFVLLVIAFLQQLPDSKSRDSSRDTGHAKRPVWPSSVKLPSYKSLRIKSPKAQCIKGERKSRADFSCPRMLPAPQVGADPALTVLLADFFHWASNQLPSLCAEHSLSVETARVERRSQKFGGAPLLLTVPFTSHDNAARCLRRDIWEGSILPEFSRAHQLIARLARSPKKAVNQGKVKTSAVKSLFKAKGAQDSSVEEEVAQKPEAEHVGWYRGRRKRSASSCVNEESATDNGDANSDASALRESATSRRRKRRHAWSELGSEAEAFAHPSKPRSHYEKSSEKASVSPESRPAPVDRWLGLRALLNPVAAKRE